MLEREILAFACPTCGRGLVVVDMASRAPEEPPRRRGVRGKPLDPAGGLVGRGSIILCIGLRACARG